jgi:hypothetical protein
MAASVRSMRSGALSERFRAWPGCAARVDDGDPSVSSSRIVFALGDAMTTTTCGRVRDDSWRRV